MQEDAELKDALIELDNLRRRDERRRFESEILLRAVKVLADHPDGQEVSHSMLDTVHDALQADRTILFRHQDNGHSVKMALPDGIETSRCGMRPFLDTVKIGVPRVVFDLSRLPNWRLEGEKDNFSGASLVTIGLSAYDRRFVLLCVRRDLPAFSRNDMELFGRLGTLIEQALLREADLKKRERLEIELRNSQKLEALGTLAGGVAHEINTPLQYVSDNMQFLETGFDDILALMQKAQTIVESQGDSDLTDKLSAEAEEADLDFLREELPATFNQTREGVAQISRIVQAIKEFSHPGSSDKTPVNLNGTIDTALTVTKNQWKYVADVKTDLDPHLPSVPCLVDGIRQVILNLLINAAHTIAEKLGPRGEKGRGQITVRSRKGNESVIIDVEDTGMGIPDDIADKVFELFFTTKAPGQGTGQGLALCHSIVVQQHKGRLSFKSKPGVGTCFRVELPL